jgi:chromodomain-helicase-DNA-binding protein 4
LDDTPEKLSKSKSKAKSKSKSAGSDGSAYTGSAAPSDREDSDSDDSSAAQEFSLATEESGNIPSMSHHRSKLIPGQSSSNRYDNPPLSPIQNYVNRDAVDFCGLCDARHGNRIGDCPMTDRSENLAEFREMLILHAEDEPLEQRVCERSFYVAKPSLTFPCLMISARLSSPSTKHCKNVDISL